MDEPSTTSAAWLCGLQACTLGGSGVPMPPAMQLALDASFGNVGHWRDACAALALARQGVPGWVLLAFQPQDGSLVNQWTEGHASDWADRVPLLALRTDAVACQAQPAAAVAQWLAAAMDRIDWAAVHGRYQQAVLAASEAFGASPDQTRGALLLDVRRSGVFGSCGTMLPGARWCDPALVLQWLADLPANRPLVLYCVHGHEVSRATTLRLRAAGLPARYLCGGIDAWQAAGRPLVDKPVGWSPG